jgi:hypothetical protein
MNKIIKDLSRKYTVNQLSSACALAMVRAEEERNGILRCKFCDDVLRQGDNLRSCRFCNASSIEHPENSLLKLWENMNFEFVDK